MSPDDQLAYNIVLKFFKNDQGEPFKMTSGQISLFRAIYERQEPRIQFDCYTQYGKSDIVSMAVLLRVSTFQEKWIILGASKVKASIIMSKLIKHIFESDYTLGKFQIDKDENLDYIRRSRAKDNITFKINEQGAIGQVITLSADARRKSQDAGDILIGHGGQNLVEDDAALIPDPIHGKALRMLGGHPDNFLLKITNSFGRNHAFRSRNDPKFKKFVIPYTQGITEGRVTEEFIQEMKEAFKNDPITFGILYECTYPPSNMIEDGDWMPLLTDEQIEEAQKRVLQSNGIKKMGVDIAEGTNLNAFVIRTDNVSTVKETNTEPNLMKTTARVTTIKVEEYLLDSNIWVDSVAIGAGVVSRLLQLGLKINAFKGGESAPEKSAAEKVTDPVEYFNMRAYVYWKARQWILQGGALTPHPAWRQLSRIKYKTAADKKVRIMSKEEMHARGELSLSESTDVPDAWAMTFAPSGTIVYNMKASAPLKPYYPGLDGPEEMSIGFNEVNKSLGSASPLSSPLDLN